MVRLQGLVQVLNDPLHRVHLGLQLARHVGAMLEVLGDVERVHQAQTGDARTDLTLNHQKRGARHDDRTQETQARGEPSRSEFLGDESVRVVLDESIREGDEVRLLPESADGLDAVDGLAQAGVDGRSRD